MHLAARSSEPDERLRAAWCAQARAWLWDSRSPKGKVYINRNINRVNN